MLFLNIKFKKQCFIYGTKLCSDVLLLYEFSQIKSVDRKIRRFDCIASETTILQLHIMLQLGTRYYVIV